MVVTKYYSYRKAWTRGRVASFDRETMNSLENRLLKAIGKIQDNHVVFEVIDLDGDIKYLGFSDDRLYIANHIDLDGDGREPTPIEYSPPRKVK